MIPLYTLNLLTLGQRQEKRVWRDVANVCLLGWAAFLMYVIARGL